jgi:hypothetical protein
MPYDKDLRTFLKALKASSATPADMQQRMRSRFGEKRIGDKPVSPPDSEQMPPKTDSAA